MTSSIRTWIACGAMLAASCAEQERTTVQARARALPAEWVDVLTVSVSAPKPGLDILFVVEDTHGMAPKQLRIASALESFVKPLYRYGVSLHVGVTTTDMGRSSLLAPQEMPGRAGALVVPDATSPPFLTDLVNPDGTRIRNFSGELVPELGRRIQAGENGDLFPQPLSAAQAALEHAPTGFIRDTAALSIVFITSRDDCSALDPALFVGDDLFRCFEHGVVCEPDDPGKPGVKQGCVPREDSALVRPIADLESYLIGLKGTRDRVSVHVLGADSTRVEVVEVP